MRCHRALKTKIAALMLAITTLATPSAHAELSDVSEFKLSFPGATGGILRFPNTNQDKDEGNAFAEAWLKQGIQFWQRGDTKIQAFYLGNYVRDTEPYPWNNSTKHGVGLQLSTRLGDHLELTFSVRHDWYKELESGFSRKGWRFAIDYYYYRYFPKDGGGRGPFSHKANVFKSYGTLASPGSLEKGDDNIVLTIGGEYSADYKIGESDWLIVPFVDFHMSWDKDQNNYNNKAIPAVGLKFRKPIKNGELFGGVKLESDFRWVADTVDTGPIVFAGWYRGW